MRPYRESSPAPKEGMRIEVYWPKDSKYYKGVVSNFYEKTGIYRVEYDDGDVKNLNLNDKNWCIENEDNRQLTAFITLSVADIDDN